MDGRRGRAIRRLSRHGQRGVHPSAAAVRRAARGDARGSGRGGSTPASATGRAGSGMSKYLYEGWHEFLIPAESRGGPQYLRVWIDMEDVVPMLRRLDQVYGDEEHRWALRVEDIPDAQRELLDMVIDHLISRPEAIRRIAVHQELAAGLA